MKLDFISKKRSYNRYKQDVTIKAVNNTNRGITIVFKNKAKERITKNGYLSIAITEDRLYFAEKTKDEGYKASQNGAFSYRLSIMNPDLYAWAKNNEGNYMLNHDDTLNYYYIDLNDQ